MRHWASVCWNIQKRHGLVHQLTADLSVNLSGTYMSYVYMYMLQLRVFQCIHQCQRTAWSRKTSIVNSSEQWCKESAWENYIMSDDSNGIRSQDSRKGSHCIWDSKESSGKRGSNVYMIDHDARILEATEADSKGQQNDSDVRLVAWDVADSNEECPRHESSWDKTIFIQYYMVYKGNHNKKEGMNLSVTHPNSTWSSLHELYPSLWNAWHLLWLHPH